MKTRVLEFLRGGFSVLIAVPLSVIAFVVVVWYLIHKLDNGSDYTRLDED